MHPLQRLTAQNGYTIVNGANSSPSGEKYFAFYKGDATDATIASAEDWSGNAIPSDVITFLNDEVPKGDYYLIPLMNVTLTIGSISLAREQKVDG